MRVTHTANFYLQATPGSPLGELLRFGSGAPEAAGYAVMR